MNFTAYHQRSVQALLCFFLFSMLFLFSCGSPVKKGYSLLDKNEPEAAKQQFQKNIDHKTNGIAAAQGLRETLIATADDNSTVTELFALQRAAKKDAEIFRKTNFKVKNKLRRQSNFSAGRYKSASEKLQITLFDKLKESKDILDLDTFLTLYPKPVRAIRKQIDTLVGNAFAPGFNNSGDYVQWLDKLKAKPLQQQLKEDAITYVRQASDLLELDTFMKYIPLETLEPDTVRKQFYQAREDLVKYTTEMPSSYARLTSIFHNHSSVLYHLIALSGQSDLISELNTRLFSAFLIEYPLKDIRRFRDDHPTHSISADCKMDDLIEAAESDNQVAELIRFIAGDRYSTLSFIVLKDLAIREANEELKYPPNFPKTAQERKTVRVVNIAAELLPIVNRGQFSEKNVAAYQEFARLSAPNAFGFDVTYHIVSDVWKQRNWNLAQRVVEIAKPLFPAQTSPCPVKYFQHEYRADWLRTAKALLRRPAQGIEPYLLKGFQRKITSAYEAPLISLGGSRLYCAENNTGVRYDLEKSYSGRFYFDGVPQYINPAETRMIVRDSFNSFLRLTYSPAVSGKPAAWKRKKEEILPLAIRETFQTIQKIHLTPDEKVMVFAANRGQFDPYRQTDFNLYLTKKNENGKWGAPITLDSLNSIGDEYAPFLHADGQTLYFLSQNFEESVGYTDVFVSRRLDDSYLNWSPPYNLGKELNSPQPDWGQHFSVDMKGQAYFEEEVGFILKTTNIFTTRLPTEALPRPGQDLVEVDYETNDGTDPLITAEVRRRSDGSLIRKVSNRPYGYSTFVVPDSVEIDFLLSGSAIFPTVESINRIAGKIDTKSENIPVITVASMLRDSVPVPLNYGQFAYDESTLTPALRRELDFIGEWLSDKKYKVIVEGHTDNVGNPEYNTQLSFQRAGNVAAYLQRKGIAGSRIRSVGLGDTQPIADNETEMGREQNRRIVIRLDKPKSKVRVN